MDLEEHAKSLAKRAKSRVGNVIVAYEVKKWPEGRLEQLLKMRVLRSLPDADEIRCPGCTERHMIVPIRTILPNGESYSEHLCSKEGLIEIPAFLFKRWQIVIEKMIELGYIKKPEKADETKELSESEEENINKNSNSLYLGLNLAERTVIVGERTYDIRSEKVWAFIKELAHDRKQRQVTKRMDGPNDWKNARDMFRRQLQKDFGKEGTNILRRMIPSSKGCYMLDSSVVVKGGGQVGIRRTKSEQNKPGAN